MKKTLIKTLLLSSLLVPMASQAVIVDYNYSDNIKLTSIVDISNKTNLEFEGREVVFTYKTEKNVRNNRYLKPIFLTIKWIDYKTNKAVKTTTLELNPKHNIYSDRIEAKEGKIYKVEIYINDIKAKIKDKITINDDLKIIDEKDLATYKSDKMKKEETKEKNKENKSKETTKDKKDNNKLNDAKSTDEEMLLL